MGGAALQFLHLGLLPGVHRDNDFLSLPAYQARDARLNIRQVLQHAHIRDLLEDMRHFRRVLPLLEPHHVLVLAGGQHLDAILRIGETAGPRIKVVEP